MKTDPRTISGPSIIIPTKDRPHLMHEAVLSALHALPDAKGEVIVVDDRSDVPAAQALADITDQRLRVITSTRPAGPSGARNAGVAAAKGNPLMFLDDDDLMVRGYPAFVMSQTADYGYSAIIPFTATPDMPDHYESETAPLSALPFRRQLAGLGCGFWITRACFGLAGGLAEDISVNEDTEFSVRLLSLGQSGIRAQNPAVFVRQHAPAAKGDVGHITQRTSAVRRAAFFGMIRTRHENWLAENRTAEQYLLKRQLKLLAKGGAVRAAFEATKNPLSLGYFAVNAGTYAVKRLLSRQT